MSEEKLVNASKLPGFDCHACELGCREMATRISAGTATYEDCKALGLDGISLVVNGEPVALTPFPAKFLAGTVIGALSALKGVDAVQNLQLRIVLPEDEP